MLRFTLTAPSRDLQALARGVVANIGSEGGARRSRSIVAAASTSDELATEVHAFFADRLAAAHSIVERAVERNEIDAGVDPTLLVGPIWLRLLLTGEPIDENVADEVARLVAAGVAS